MILQMPNNACPNIKTDILELRNKIGEMTRLKSELLRSNPAFEESLNDFQLATNRAFELIKHKLDTVANEGMLFKIKRTQKYMDVGYFYEGRAKARLKNGEWCHIDYKGDLSYQTEYCEVDDFYEGMAAVAISQTNFVKEYCHIDKHGVPIYPHRFKRTEAYVNGKATVETFGGDVFFIDLNGNPILY
jgi:hypothetical protein